MLKKLFKKSKPSAGPAREIYDYLGVGLVEWLEYSGWKHSDCFTTDRGVMYRFESEGGDTLNVALADPKDGVEIRGRAIFFGTDWNGDTRVKIGEICVPEDAIEAGKHVCLVGLSFCIDNVTKSRLTE